MPKKTLDTTLIDLNSQDLSCYRSSRREVFRKKLFFIEHFWAATSDVSDMLMMSSYYKRFNEQER